MNFKPGNHHRRSIRLKDYDYSQAGAYFVTICTWQRECQFGDIVDGEMRLNEFGRIVWNEWQRTPDIRPQVSLDESIVMPNHIHGIIVINGGTTVGAYCNTPLPNTPLPNTHLPNAPRQRHSPSQTIGAIVRGFKSATTKQINILRNNPGRPVWQRSESPPAKPEAFKTGDRSKRLIQKII